MVPLFIRERASYFFEVMHMFDLQSLKCMSTLEAHPCLLEDEENYEPPQDPDSGK
jgi:hypothetical protein